MAKDFSDEKHLRFPTTRWSLVDVAGDSLSPEQREALNLLLTQYWGPLKTHLVTKKRFSGHDAEDLIQGFIKLKILEKNLVELAKKDRGKFRSLLLKSLDNYVANELRARSAKKRGPDVAGSLNAISNDNWAAHERTPAKVQDLDWAQRVITNSLELMKQQCKSEDKQKFWMVFELRIVGPILQGTAPGSYEKIVADCGFQSKDQASNALVTAKRIFERCLKTVLAEQGVEESEIERELQDLLECLAGY